jgi:hypothetical protein
LVRFSSKYYRVSSFARHRSSFYLFALLVSSI